MKEKIKSYIFCHHHLDKITDFGTSCFTTQAETTFMFHYAETIFSITVFNGYSAIPFSPLSIGTVVSCGISLVGKISYVFTGSDVAVRCIGFLIYCGDVS